jgi:hypothetical protein
LIERNAELNKRDGSGAPKRTENVAPDDTGQVVISLCLDAQVLARIDADAKRMGISRTAWLHLATDERLEGRR